jgi:hypothetical protein
MVRVLNPYNSKTPALSFLFGIISITLCPRGGHKIQMHISFEIKNLDVGVPESLAYTECCALFESLLVL